MHQLGVREKISIEASFSTRFSEEGCLGLISEAAGVGALTASKRLDNWRRGKGQIGAKD